MENRKQRHALPIRGPALSQLAAESRAFAEQHAQAVPALRRVREIYQREISSLPGVKPYLGEFEARSFKPERVLKYLAALVLLERDATWKNDTEKIKNTLRTLGKRLRMIAGEVERAYATDANRPDLWAMSLGFPSAPATPPNHRKAVESMRETAANLEARARAFGRLRKEISPAVRRAPVVALLWYVCKPHPWSGPECSPELCQRLAELLHAVCEKYGLETSFTAESLLKTFKRHVLPPSAEAVPDKTPDKK